MDKDSIFNIFIPIIFISFSAFRIIKPESISSSFINTVNSIGLIVSFIYLCASGCNISYKKLTIKQKRIKIISRVLTAMIIVCILWVTFINKKEWMSDIFTLLALLLGLCSNNWIDTLRRCYEE